MWLFTSDFVVSVVQKDPLSDDLCVRARDADDLDRLREQYLPMLTETVEGAGTDYPYRAFAPKAAVALAAAVIVRDIDYSNYKDAVTWRRGWERARILHKVWAVLLELTPRGDRAKVEQDR